MTDDARPAGEDDLTAFIDGRLAEDRRAAVARYLDENPAIRSRVSADKAARDNLRQRLGPVADLPIPDRLRVDAILAGRRKTFRRRLQMAAYGILLIAGGGVAGWEARGLILSGPSAREQAAILATSEDAISAHRLFAVETVHPVEVGAAQETHLIQWLSKRVGHNLAVPDLTGQGFVLMGGRLLPSGDEAAAQFMYESKSGPRLTVYVRAIGGGDTRFRFAEADGVSAFSWIDQGLGFAIVGAIDRPHLLEIADTVYRQVDPQHRAAPGAL